jgi:hypothetical protein
MSCNPHCCVYEREVSLDDCVGREKRKKIGLILITGLTENLSGNRSSRAGLKEGAVAVVGEYLPQEEIDIDIKSRALGKKKKRKGDTPLGCSGQSSLHDVTLNNTQCCVLPHVRLHRLWETLKAVQPVRVRTSVKQFSSK